MIPFESFVLSNGLRVYVHEDHTTPMAAVNILYNVGAKDEDENKTGFAHLFEHLMFGGSQHIPSYEEPLQIVGGENNAFTSNDITNYYITLPSVNLETAFWLESDRMLALSFQQEVLDTQKSVVIEEFKQRYLNQPYGDAWLHLRPLAYKVHPYRWATIGKDISHIESATLSDVKEFFYKFYVPSNAILVVGGDVTVSEVERLARKWFGPIDSGRSYHRNLPQEPTQTEPRILEVEASVPLDAIYQTYHSPARTHEDYYASDLLSDILGRGKSSRLYSQLVKEEKLFNNISAYVSGGDEAGLIIIQGNLNKGVVLSEGLTAIERMVNGLVTSITEEELEKVKNKAISTYLFSEGELLNRVMALAHFANLGDIHEVNREVDKIRKVTLKDIERLANDLLVKSNQSTLLYKSQMN